MKKFLLSLLIAAPVVMHAEQAGYVPADAQQITYKVTIYRDEKYDQKTWDKLVADASNAIKRSAQLKDEDQAATEEIAKAFVESIEEVYRRAKSAHDGIHGSMSIEVSDGD